MESMVFNDWNSLLRILIIGTMAFISIIFLLRISGKRTLSKMNSFDYIITLAIGSSFATIILNKDISLAEGVLTFALLIFLQFFVAWISVRIPFFKKVLTSTPSLLVYKGNIFDDALRKERITREELDLYLREHGVGDLSKIDIVVLETTGDLTVIKNIDVDDAETLRNVKGIEHVFSER